MEKYIYMYKEFISQLCMYEKGGKNSFKGLLTHFSFTPIEIARHIRRSQRLFKRQIQIMI